MQQITFIQDGTTLDLDEIAPLTPFEFTWDLELQKIDYDISEQEIMDFRLFSNPHFQKEKETNSVIQLLGQFEVERDTHVNEAIDYAEVTLDEIEAITALDNLFMCGKKVLRAETYVHAFEYATMEEFSAMNSEEDTIYTTSIRKIDGFRETSLSPAHQLILFTVDSYKVFQFQQGKVRVVYVESLVHGVDGAPKPLTEAMVNRAMKGESLLQIVVDSIPYVICSKGIVVRVSKGRILFEDGYGGPTTEPDGEYVLTRKGDLVWIKDGTVSSMVGLSRRAETDSLQVSVYDLNDYFTIARRDTRPFPNVRIKEICQLGRVRIPKDSRPVMRHLAKIESLTMNNVIDACTRGQENGMYCIEKPLYYMFNRSLCYKNKKVISRAWFDKMYVYKVYSRRCNQNFFISNCPTFTTKLCVRAKVPELIRGSFKTYNEWSMVYLSSKRPSYPSVIVNEFLMEEINRGGWMSGIAISRSLNLTVTTPYQNYRFERDYRNTMLEDDNQIPGR